MKLANPAPLGLAGFALTTWLLSLINTGFLGEDSMPLVLATAFAFGGTAQFFAGLLELLTHIGGYLGLVTAACAFYLSAAEVINETHDRTRLPTGPYAPFD